MILLVNGELLGSERVKEVDFFVEVGLVEILVLILYLLN